MIDTNTLALYEAFCQATELSLGRGIPKTWLPRHSMPIGCRLFDVSLCLVNGLADWALFSIEFSMSDLYRNAADLLIQTFPGVLESDAMAQYGLHLDQWQKQEIHRMLLSLWFYWVQCGLRVSVPQDPAREIEHAVRQWMEEFSTSNFPGTGSENIFQTSEQLHRHWEQIMREGDEPINVLSHAVSVLEDQGVIEAGAQQYGLAFFLDFVPIEEIGHVMLTIEAYFA